MRSGGAGLAEIRRRVNYEVKLSIAQAKGVIIIIGLTAKGTKVRSNHRKIRKHDSEFAR